MSVSLNNQISSKLTSYRARLLEWCNETEKYLLDHTDMMDMYSTHMQDIYDVYAESESGAEPEDLSNMWLALKNKYVDPAHGVRTKTEQCSFVGPDGDTYEFESVVNVDAATPYYIKIFKINSDAADDKTLVFDFDDSTQCMEAIAQNDLFFDTRLSDNVSLTLNDIGRGFGDIYTSFSATLEATRQYLAGTLSVSSVGDIMTRLTIGGSEVCSNLLIAITNNFSTLVASPSAWLDGIKTILNQVIDATLYNNHFYFGLDTYNVGTSVLVGVKTVVSAISSIAATITTIFNPIIGLAVGAVGAVASRIAEVISDNESDSIKYNEDADIVCFGQNIFRAFAYLPNFDYTFDSYGSNIIQTISPITCSLVYNNVKQDSLHRGIVPVQEFIIPMIPVHAAAYDALAGIFNTGNQTTVNWSWISDGTKSYYQETYAVSGSNVNSSATRRQYALNFLNLINDHPEYVHFCDEQDSDETIKAGIIFSLTLWKMISVQPSSPTYTSKTFTLNYMKAANYASHISDEDMEGNDFADYFFSFIRMMRASIGSIGNYDPNNYPVFDTWFDKVIFNTGSTYCMAGLNLYNWAALVNTVMIEDLAVGSIANEIFTAGSTIPYTIIPIDAKSSYGVYMVPPKQSIKLWIRLALTIGIIVTTVTTAAVAFYTAKKNARRSFTNQCINAKTHYDKWIETGSDIEYSQYRKSMRKANFAGKLFGFGSYDVANDWIDSSISNVGGVVNSLIANNESVGSTLADIIASVPTTVKTNTDSSIDTAKAAIIDEIGDVIDEIHESSMTINANIEDVSDLITG